MELNEKALLGQAVISPDTVLALCVDMGLDETQFTNEVAAQTFAKLSQLWGMNQKIDGTVFANERFYAECRALVPVLDLPRCIRNIQNTAKNLRLKNKLLYEASGIDLNQESDHQDTLALVQKSIDEFTVEGEKEKPFWEVAHGEAERILNGKPDANMIPWPFESLDNLAGRLSNELVFVTARPSVGKTAFILAWLLKLMDEEIPSALLSLESGPRSLSLRAIGHLSGVNMARFRTGDFREGDAELIRSAVARLAKHKPVINHGVYTMEKIYSYARTQKKKGMRILFIDNLKHIKASKKYASRVDQFADYSAQLKWLRDELELPVVTLHHLNRANDIAQSDDIERDADIVITMTKNEGKSVAPTRDNKWQEKAIVDIEISKARDAGTGAFSVEFHKKHQRFTEAT